MWHELVLHGIGGKTIAEAKANLTYHEAQSWFAFLQQRGGISHIDRLLATIATQINRVTGGKAEIGDFLPMLKSQESDEETPATLGEIMNILTKAAN